MEINMSRIEASMKELKKQNIREGWKEGKKVAVSFRCDPFTIFCLDEIIKEVGGTRTSNGVEMVTAGVLDGLAALGRDFDSLQKEYFKQCGQGIFVDGIKIDDPDDFIANPEKYIELGQSTEAEKEEMKERFEAEQYQAEQDKAVKNV